MPLDTFKNKRGGDPSRIPLIVIVNFPCPACDKPCSFETRKPKGFIPPQTCSTQCASAFAQKQAQNLIREVIGSSTPTYGTVPQNMAVELLVAQEWMEQAKASKVRRVRINCAHCGNPADRFAHVTARTDKAVSRFCSGDCKESSIHGLPSGVICRSPRKASQATFAAAIIAATEMNTKLFLEGDIEGVQPYECSCGSWHVGHGSKRVWLDAARVTLSIITERTVTLTQ